MPRRDLRLRYSTYLGGTKIDIAHAVRSSADGGDVLVGETFSADFPTTPGVVQPAFGGGDSDAFVAKFSANGQLLFATFLGGSGADGANGLDIDSAGNLYVVGTTNSPDFPTQFPYQATLAGGFDAFLTKLTPTASAIIYSTYLGGTDQDLGRAVRVDDLMQPVVVGQTASADFPTTPGAFDTTFNGGATDAFVTKFASFGSALIFSSFLGGEGGEDATSVDVDSFGAPVVVGETSSALFPTVPGSFDTTLTGPSDAFATKFTPLGNALAYSTYLGGSSFDRANGVVLDASGNAFIVGQTRSGNFPTTPGVVQPLFAGGEDAFITQLNRFGTALIASTYLGGSLGDVGTAIDLDPQGNPAITGFTGSFDFPVTLHAVQPVFGGGLFDAFMALLTADLTELCYSTYLGGSGNDFGTGVAVHANPDITVVGQTSSPDFPLERPFQPTLRGTDDAFVTRFTSPQRRTPAPAPLFVGRECPPLRRT